MLLNRRIWVLLAAATVSASAASPAHAQKPGKVSYVTVAIAKNPNERGRIKAFKNNPSVILLDGDNLTPESFATLFSAYASLRRNGLGSGKDVTIRSASQPQHALTLKQRQHYQRILDNLQASAERQVPGVGKVHAVDVPFIGGQP